MNASANRGACNQICRRSYTVRDRETNHELDVDNAYIMSPKDLKTIHFLNKLIDAGVRVFKIEGRARGPEYVRTVTECYAEAATACCDGTFDEARIAAWDERLSTVFNRGFWNGYYLGQRLGEWTHRYGSSATRRKEYVARGVKYFGGIGAPRKRFAPPIDSIKWSPLALPKFIEEPPAARSGMCSEMEQVNLSFFEYQPSYRLRNSLCLLIYTAYRSTNRRCFAIHAA